MMDEETQKKKSNQKVSSYVFVVADQFTQIYAGVFTHPFLLSRLSFLTLAQFNSTTIDGHPATITAAKVDAAQKQITWAENFAGRFEQNKDEDVEKLLQTYGNRREWAR